MKLGKIKYILPLVTSVLLTGCNFITIKDNNGEDEEIIIYETVDKYYEKYDLKQKGGRLQNELHKMCFEKHKYYVTYGQVNSYFSKKTLADGKYQNSVEAVSDGSSKNQWFYTGKEAGGVGTREHVWPCANSGSLWVHDSDSGLHYVDYSYYVGGGSDLYHVRTSNSNVNTARGNSRFVDFDDPEMESFKSEVVPVGENNGKYNLLLQGAEKTTAGNYQYANRCEPDDHMKGDIARILLYVWVHYSDIGVTPEGKVKSGKYEYKYSDMIGSLALTNIIGYSSLSKCQNMLKEWNKIDPPSEVEKLRNETVSKIQGNRNPFVDYPELVDNLF